MRLLGCARRRRGAPRARGTGRNGFSERRRAMARPMTGAEMVIKALIDQGVEAIFGYPGGAVLPIYDELFQQDEIRHILVRQEGGAVHAAEGYARPRGKGGAVLGT